VTACRTGKPVLSGVDLEIGSGATAVLGASGSGKSTLLRLLNRLADPEQGTVFYRGDDVRELDPLSLRRRVGLVPQLPAPFDGTVEDNVAAGRRYAGGGPEPDTASLLERVGLDAGFAGREAGKLSVGEQQRVMLARALALEPEVLLLDEPTSALDQDARAEVEATLSDLSMDLVVVTHDVGQAERLSDRIVRLEAGRVKEDGG
jgi:putative ABC transport system ATP-binding protein